MKKYVKAYTEWEDIEEMSTEDLEDYVCGQLGSEIIAREVFNYFNVDERRAFLESLVRDYDL